jgi:hypothetical protein
VAGECRNFFLAADYGGDLVAPNAPTVGDVDALVVIAGRY